MNRFYAIAFVLLIARIINFHAMNNPEEQNANLQQLHPERRTVSKEQLEQFRLKVQALDDQLTKFTDSVLKPSINIDLINFKVEKMNLMNNYTELYETYLAGYTEVKTYACHPVLCTLLAKAQNKKMWSLPPRSNPNYDDLLVSLDTLITMIEGVQK